MPRWSKQWWKLNRQLLNKKAKMSCIPPLREDSTWISDAKGKADLFARTFAGKAEIPQEIVDPAFFGRPDVEMDMFVAIRSRYTMKLLKQLKIDKATGHDKISAAILQRIGKFIAVPFTKVCRRLLSEGCWPKQWRYHFNRPHFQKKTWPTRLATIEESISHLFCPRLQRKSSAKFCASSYRSIPLARINGHLHPDLAHVT